MFIGVLLGAVAGVFVIVAFGQSIGLAASTACAIFASLVFWIASLAVFRGRLWSEIESAFCEHEWHQELFLYSVGWEVGKALEQYGYPFDPRIANSGGRPGMDASESVCLKCGSRKSSLKTEVEIEVKRQVKIHLEEKSKESLRKVDQQDWGHVYYMVLSKRRLEEEKRLSDIKNPDHPLHCTLKRAPARLG